MSIKKEVKGYFQCPNCRARFEEEKRLYMHFEAKPECRWWADCLLELKKIQSSSPLVVKENITKMVAD